MAPVANDLATRYALDVLDGKITAGSLVIDACKRHLHDLEHGSARGLIFNVEKANLACDFFPSVLTVTEGAKEGQPFHLLPWHGFVVASTFGWYRQDGLRRFRSAWMETGKGQAKSPLMAGIGLYMMGFTGKMRSEVYAISSDKDQANVLFKDGVSMCRVPMPGYEEGNSLESEGIVVIRGTGDNAWKIEHPETGSKFQSLASADSISGPRPYCVLADEIHEMKNPYALQIWKAAIDKMAGDPLMILGTNTPSINQIVGTEYSDMFQKVTKGGAAYDSLFSFIARVDREDYDTVFDNEKCWPKALPALGVTFPVSNIRERVNVAKAMLSEALSTKRLYFGIPTGSDSFWISETAWNSVQGVVDEKEMRGLPCWLGLDLSQKNDLTALTAVWVKEKDKENHFYAKTWYFTTKEGIFDRARDDNASYPTWVEEGFLEAVPGSVIEKDYVAELIAQICSNHKVQYMAFDPAGIEDFTLACERVGFPVWRFKGPDKPKGKGLMMVSHSQGTRIVFEDRALCMPKSIQKLEDAVLNGHITVDKNPVTTMCAANVAVISDTMNNRAFDKKRSRGRIDGMVSLAEAVGAASFVFEARKPQYSMFVLG